MKSSKDAVKDRTGHDSELDRFREAQDRPGSGFDAALREIQAGAKQGHWIWYVFPQLSGLGMSSVSRTYGIHGLAEAEDYLRDATLRSRLLAIATAVAAHLSQGVSLETLMGSSTDALKLVSSLTLFAHAARELHAAEGLADYATLARTPKSSARWYGEAARTGTLPGPETT